MARAIVDVDGILWDFHTPLAQRLGMKELPGDWGFYRRLGISEADFYATVRLVHESQYNGAAPFGFARSLLRACWQRYGEVIIATHRPADDGARVAMWLVSFGLMPFSGVYAGSDKTFLIGDSDLVVDDSPATIRVALERGATALTIAYPWNEGTGAIRVPDGEWMPRLIAGVTA